MMWPRPNLHAVASLSLAVVLATPAYGETSDPARPGEGLTRETFSDPSAPAHVVASAPAAPRRHTKRTRLDSKDFLSIHHATHRQRAHTKGRTQVAAITNHPPNHPQPRRNPVVSFVYWWNGFVIKTFHTKVGTVMLGRIGAKT